MQPLLSASSISATATIEIRPIFFIKPKDILMSQPLDQTCRFALIQVLPLLNSIKKDYNMVLITIVTLATYYMLSKRRGAPEVFIYNLTCSFYYLETRWGLVYINFLNHKKAEKGGL